MPRFSRSATRNALLSKLDDGCLAPLLPHLESRSLTAGQVLCEYDTLIPAALFLESGVASTVVASPDGHVVEILIVGREGMCGLPLLLGRQRSAAKVFMHGPGSGWAVPAATLLRLMDEQPGFRAVMMDYVHAAMLQTAYTSLSNAAHSVEQRLARWLLMIHDRTDGDELVLTHDAIAFMLNVRRPSVTDAIHMVEGYGLIRASRGRIIIRDRQALEVLAAAAYGVPEAASRPDLPNPSPELRASG